MNEASDVFVAVHAGAGNHSKSNEHLYKAVCKAACQQAISMLRAKRSALEAVTAAVVVLENDECTNAGQGSNLTIEGIVECDASAMDGKSLLFGAVGALSGVTNPVKVASRLVEEQKKGPLPFGRVRPSVLVGKGAQAYCAESGINVSDSLISENAFRTYCRYKRKCQLDKPRNFTGKKRKVENLQTNGELHSETQNLFSADSDWVQDTVGAVCVDHEGNVAAATSSGGIWLKHSGRLGPTAMYGAGCWAQNQISEAVASGVAAVTSGCGEHIIQTVLAKTCSDAIRSSSDVSQALASTFQDSFLGSEFLATKTEKFGGVLILKTVKVQSSKEVEISWIHSTASMCLAYMAGNKKSPTTIMSRLEENCVPGQSFTMGGHLFML